MTTPTINEFVARYRADLQPVRLLIDLVCLPTRVDDADLDAQCKSLRTALALSAAQQNHSITDDDDEITQIIDIIARIAAADASAERASGAQALIESALGAPDVLLSSEWQTQLRSAWPQVALYELNRRSDLASIAATQYPVRLCDAGDDDELFGYGATLNQNRWSAPKGSEVRDRVLSNVAAADLAQWRNRVTLCHFHLQGYCSKGAQCERAHVGPSLGTVCTFFAAGACAKGDECAFLHELERMPCAAAPRCSDAAQCPFSHDAQLADFYEATQKRKALALQQQQQQQR